MKRTRTLLAFALALFMAFAFALPARADEGGEATQPSTPSITINPAENQQNTTYTWYRILDASIGEDPSQDDAVQTGGEVAYYVTTSERAAQLQSTKLFNVTRVDGKDIWYVELIDANTPAEDIADAFAADTFDLTKFASGTFTQGEEGAPAKSGTVEAGYYYITSPAGTKTVVQTLTAVEINEKNTFPTVEKTIAEDDEDAQIGDEINYTLTVTVPGTANQSIVLTDTMTDGLTFKAINSVKAGEDNVEYNYAPIPVGNAKEFTITFDAETVAENQGKTIVIDYSAILNKDAEIDGDNDNEVKLNYGNIYETVPSKVTTKTYSFTFDKVDGTDGSKLTGAEFQLQIGETALSLVEVEAGKTYRIATADDTTTTTTIVTNGNTITINGLDADVTYTLVETKAPTSYNKLDDGIPVTANNNVFAHQNVANNKGAVMPSTGGIGTTIFYIVGGVMVAGAVIFLLTKRRASAAE